MKSIRKLTEEERAEVRLIAAAPALLQTLEEIDFGLQLWLDQYGDQDGLICSMKEQVRSTLDLVRTP